VVGKSHLACACPVRLPCGGARLVNALTNPPIHHSTTSLSPPPSPHAHSLALQTQQDIRRLAAVCCPPSARPRSACPPPRAYSSPWSTPATAFALCSAPSSDLPADRGVTYEPCPPFPAKPWLRTLNSSPGRPSPPATMQGKSY
jgi:hypothetical protein